MNTNTQNKIIDLAAYRARLAGAQSAPSTDAPQDLAAVCGVEAEILSFLTFEPHQRSIVEHLAARAVEDCVKAMRAAQAIWNANPEASIAYGKTALWAPFAHGMWFEDIDAAHKFYKEAERIAAQLAGER